MASYYEKVRFETFKRDDFTCQYCGRRAPAVVLNLEHIEPVSLGGTADPWNFVTACEECNQGKHVTRLSADQVKRLDTSTPNIIGQLCAEAMHDPTVLQRMVDVSYPARAFGPWMADMERLFDWVGETWEAINIAGAETE